ncbi:conserved hypothetical protein [Desulfarculus baarsii DSM 2075]|uniref:Uncharacterized protein n=1 Tax=Desulfarculus baarsii (strain ATCC 33931 / DSM 2075 / LMG 7858 / VKM B-1802 / 2st14) TaxID=644282 RepID=E1QKW3_DESB2|nr:hypothetical protein [Desulfarculus baarsii]ADK86322.1 conserved hypothetical protein [Desulfarculus baarsii DSM 2075]
MGTWAGQDPLALLVLIALGLFGLWVTGRIVQKAGYVRWWALVILVPLLNLVFIWVFAFARWPAQQTLPEASEARGPRLKAK